MDNTEARTLDGMLYGAYIGKLRHILTTNESFNDVDTTNIEAMIHISKSIKTNKYVCAYDIRDKLSNICICDICDSLSNINGSILYAISPLAFVDIFDTHQDFKTVIEQVIDVLDTSQELKMLYVEYIYLLHDILWFKIDKDDILKIIPELDVSESEVICSNEEKDVFFAALWSFVFSTNYINCYERAFFLKDSNSDITGLACTFAGLYYGLKSIPTDWAEQIFEFSKDENGTSIIPIF